VEPSRDRGPSDVGALLPGQPAAGALELVFERLEDLADESPGAVAELERRRRGAAVHGREDGPRHGLEAAASRLMGLAGAGRALWPVAMTARN
jgi:hypothetical protein